MTEVPTEEPQRFFFVHIQKTAGTTLLRRLRHHFGEGAVYPLPEHQGSPDTSLGVDELVTRFAEHRDAIRVVTGHFPLCTATLLDAPFTTFTVLREPVERTLSNLRHAQKVDPRYRGAPLDDIYHGDDIRRDGLLRNHMVRMLSMTTDEMTAAGALTQVVDDQEHLERAKTNLVDHIDVFGFQEHFEEFCDELAVRYGWDLGEPTFANRTAPLDASEELLWHLSQDNLLDIELYRFALELRAQR